MIFLLVFLSPLSFSRFPIRIPVHRNGIDPMFEFRSQIRTKQNVKYCLELGLCLKRKLDLKVPNRLFCFAKIKRGRTCLVRVFENVFS